MPKKNIPSYRLHKATGQAIVVLKGKTFYLGKWKTPASRERYTLLIAEYTRSGTRTPPQSSCTEITAGELAVRFLEHAETYYVKNGKITPTFRHCKLALR
ncbi:MAG: hypothetical protein LBQ54_13285, partial [Planctomycetaceae bacterium]|nr:hypothetical protein [Planctomycetaceae bacterium]